MSIRKRQGNAVVIGLGRLGASTAFWPASQGREVVRLDNFNPVSLTSPGRQASSARQVQVGAC